MMTKTRAKPALRGPKYTFGPGDHGRVVSDEDVKNARWVERFRYEIIDGSLYVSPMPDLPHEQLKLWLFRLLLEYSDVHLNVVRNVVTPARIFIPGRRRTTVPEADIAAYRDFPYSVPFHERDWRMTSPVLVVEIVSGDVAKDLTRNVDLYERVPSIEEYWVINYWTDDDFFFRVFRKRGKRWAKPLEFKLGETYTTPLLPGFSLKLSPDV